MVLRYEWEFFASFRLCECVRIFAGFCIIKQQQLLLHTLCTPYARERVCKCWNIFSFKGYFSLHFCFSMKDSTKKEVYKRWTSIWRECALFVVVYALLLLLLLQSIQNAFSMFVYLFVVILCGFAAAVVIIVIPCLLYHYPLAPPPLPSHALSHFIRSFALIQISVSVKDNNNVKFTTKQKNMERFSERRGPNCEWVYGCVCAWMSLFLHLTSWNMFLCILSSISQNVKCEKFHADLRGVSLNFCYHFVCQIVYVKIKDLYKIC